MNAPAPAPAPLADAAASASAASPASATPAPADGTLSYEQAGVDYGLIDPLKVSAQRAAAATASHLAAHGFSEVAASRGESAYVVDVGPFYIASIVECLGSKALVADEMARLTGRPYYEGIAQDTIAMAVNDLITVGATPLVVQAYWAAGGSDWFGDAARAQALVAGWKRACDICGVAWGGGETPALAGIVEAGRIDLAASCTGLINPKARLSLGERLGAGDAIVLLASSGIHANGLSLARKLLERLPEGYMTPVGDPADPALTYGAALLAPTTLYSPVTEALWRAGIVPHYAANITGHGWRKLLRHPGAFRYRMHTVPAVPPVLKFIQQQARQAEHGCRLCALRGRGRRRTHGGRGTGTRRGGMHRGQGRGGAARGADRTHRRRLR
jgi:phosphoribosylformylglycinamidine cyclo-ligase